MGRQLKCFQFADNDTSNASGVIDFVYMGDNTKIIHDSLLVSLLIKKKVLL